MKPAYRRIVASLAMLVFLGLWVWGAATLGTQLATAPKWLTFIFFVFAGIAWVFPLRPLFKWMNAAPPQK